jgi:hypothetical protein
MARTKTTSKAARTRVQRIAHPLTPPIFTGDNPKELNAAYLAGVMDRLSHLEDLQHQVLDVQAMCTVVTAALEDDCYKDVLRLLNLASARLGDVSGALGKLCDEQQDSANRASEVANGL